MSAGDSNDYLWGRALGAIAITGDLEGWIRAIIREYGEPSLGKSPVRAHVGL